MPDKDTTPPTPKSKEELRKEIAYILDNYEPGEVRVSLSDGSSEIHSTFVLAIDDIMQLFTSYTQHLYTRQNVKAICEEVVGTDTPNEWEDDEIHAWPYYDDYSSNAADYANGYNQAKAEQRQSIDSIIDKWGK